MIADVSNNKAFYSQQEIEAENKARNPQQIILCPSTAFIKIYI